MASAIMTGEIRVSNQGNVFTKTFSAMVTVSQWYTNQVVLANGISDFVVSTIFVSNPMFIALTANSVCRVAFGGTSQISSASAGMQFRDMFALIGSGIAVSGPFNIHFSNSSGDSATITMVAAM